MRGANPYDLIQTMKNPLSSDNILLSDVGTVEGWDECRWAKKIWKMYRMLLFLEKHKVSGTNFSTKIRDIATYFAVKYRMQEN